MKTRPMKPTQPFEYRWHNMPGGVSRIADSPLDAMLEVVALELKTDKFTVMHALSLPSGSISRVRHRADAMPQRWLYRASVYSGIPYTMLCKLTEVEPELEPHENAW